MLPTQCRAARALLGWSLDKLQEMTKRQGDGVGRMTLVRFERGDPIRDDRVLAIRAALEGAGITFIGGSELSKGGGEGVRFNKVERE